MQPLAAKNLAYLPNLAGTMTNLGMIYGRVGRLEGGHYCCRGSRTQHAAIGRKKTPLTSPT